MRHLSLLAVALVLASTACNPSPTPTTTKPTTNQGSPPPPCHPGCFPAGTPVVTPDGSRPIETIRPGESVLLVGLDGVPTVGAVHSVFQTCNRLVEVKTDSGTLRTTETQPLCLGAGGFRRAGELVEGDIIWRWEGGERRPARVQAVLVAEPEAEVFNLVVGDSAVFVAGGFLARGKPPVSSSGEGLRRFWE